MAAAAAAGAASGLPGPVAQGLKEALVETLTGILSPVQEVRAAAEEQIKVLEVTEEFGVHLAELTVDPQGALAIRQLASVILKQYVETHWCAQSEKFRPPETTERAKIVIRELLPNGLRESISKVRSSVAYAVSAIAHWDWPDAWPQLFNLLMEMLVSGDLNAVHGAMRVLTEFTREVTDTQMPLVAPVILPEMYKIFTMAEVYGIRTRSRAVEIFTTCAHMICNMEELEKGAAKVLIFPVVQQFTEAFVQALQTPDGPTSDSGFKMEVLKAVTALVKNFPKHMVSSMQQILPIVWNTLTESAAFYVRTEVNYTEEVEDPVDSDGEVLGFENLVFSIFEFVHALLENSKFKSTVKKALPELIYYIILYMQITEEQIKVWTANPQQFVEDEDDDTFSYTVRIAAQDLVLAVATDFQNESAAALAAAATRHLQEAEQNRSSGTEHWWKIHEACMLALGSVKSVITDSVKSGRVHFDMHGFLTNVILVDLNLSDPERWTNIPLLVKILKLIVNELSSVMEANAARQAAPAAWSQDDSNDMWEDQEEEEDDEEDGLAGQLLSDILATSKYEEDYYEDDEEDDPDALKDPLYQIDLQAYLTDFLCQFAQQPCYVMFSGHLNDNERRVLQTIGI
uniref:Importin 9 n=1 Tax=Equus caballus TaxID=9796 RepID=A0A9L0T875_HORSE